MEYSKSFNRLIHYMEEWDHTLALISFDNNVLNHIYCFVELAARTGQTSHYEY